LKDGEGRDAGDDDRHPRDLRRSEPLAEEEERSDARNRRELGRQHGGHGDPATGADREQREANDLRGSGGKDEWDRGPSQPKPRRQEQR
jgi:hypothetical protein